MTTRDNNDDEKLVNLAVELDEQLRAKQLKSPGTRPLKLRHDRILEFSDDEVFELNDACDALSFLDQVRADMDELGLVTNDTDNSNPTGPKSTARFVLDQTLSFACDPLENIEDSFSSNQSFGRFQNIDSIGQGGFARVFRAYDPVLEREVALKIPRPHVLASDESKARFIREGKAAAMLSHPAIVAVFEAGTNGPINYIASAYCPGETLANWFSNQKQELGSQTVAKIVTRLADAVHHAHQRGVIHRDLKPANILIEDGDAELPDRIRITDFGLAKQLSSNDETLTIEGAVVGTPAYMSPEQVRCDPDIGIATDIYSLGVILYELLTGDPPHKKSGISATIRAVESEPVSSIKTHRSGVPVELDAICQKCLEKDPSQRYTTAFALSEDLNRFQNGQPVIAKHPSPMDRLVKWARRNPVIAACLSVTILTLATGVAASWSMYKMSERDRLDAIGAKNEAIDLRKSESQALQLANTRLTEMHDQMDLLTSIFEELKPSSQGVFDDKILGERLKENLILASERIFESKADPSLRSNLASRVGHSLRGLGYGTEAVEITTKALALARENNLPDSELVGLQLYVALAKHVAQEYDQVTKELGGIIDLVVAGAEFNTAKKIEALSVLSDSYFNSGRPVKAAKTRRRLIKLHDELKAELTQRASDNPTIVSRSERDYFDSQSAKRQYVTSKFRIADVEYRLDRSESNVDALISSHREVESQLGPNDFGTISSAIAVATALGQNRRVKEALKFADKAYRSSLETFGQSSGQTITAVNSQIVICGTNMSDSDCRKRLPELLGIGRDACRAYAKEFGEDSTHVIGVYGNIATAYGLTGDLKSCIEIKRHLIAIAERKYGRNHLLAQNQIMGLGVALAETGSDTEARKLLQEYLEFAKTSTTAEQVNIQAAKRSLKSITNID